MTKEANLDVLNLALYEQVKTLNTGQPIPNDALPKAAAITNIAKQIIDIKKVQNDEKRIIAEFLTPADKREVGREMAGLPLLNSDD